MDRNSTSYTLIFASIVTVVCAILLGVAATKLKPLQTINADVDKKSKILLALDEFDPKKPIPSKEVLAFFKEQDNTGKLVKKFAVNHEGTVLELSADDLRDLDLFKEMKAYPDDASKRKYPIYAYFDSKEALAVNKPNQYVVPVFGYGLWSNCFGVLALDSEGRVVNNIVYYKHGETPGLGGEIEKLKFTDPFKGKKVHNVKGEVALTTTKGDLDDNSVPAISGATFTMDGVNAMLNKFLTIYDAYFIKKRGAE